MTELKTLKDICSITPALSVNSKALKSAPDELIEAMLRTFSASMTESMKHVLRVEAIKWYRNIEAWATHTRVNPKAWDKQIEKYIVNDNDYDHSWAVLQQFLKDFFNLSESDLK